MLFDVNDLSEWRCLAFMAFPLAANMGVQALLGINKGDPFMQNNKFIKSLKHPWFAPPLIVYPIVGVAMCFLMGYASFVVYRDGGGCDAGSPARTALGFYLASMAAGCAMGPTFVGLKRIDLTVLLTLVLWVLMGATGSLFREASAAAGTLWMPAYVWITFYVPLMFAFWRENPNAANKND